MTELFKNLTIGQCFKMFSIGHTTYKKVDDNHYKAIRNIFGTKPSDEIKTMPENNLFDIVYPVE